MTASSPIPAPSTCLRHLRAAGKRVVLLSNAPRRAHVAQEALRGMGIADDLYTAILTSGEATHLMLRDRTDPWFASLGNQMFHLGPERDRNVYESLSLVRVDDPTQASFVLNTGPDDLHSASELSDHVPVLEACRTAGLPMICANPDLEVIRGGARVICAGLLTQHYESLGGEARWIGKPDPAIYLPVLAMLGLDRAKVLAVGDALRTDIAGAAASGIDFLLGARRHPRRGTGHRPQPHRRGGGGSGIRAARLPACVRLVGRGSARHQRASTTTTAGDRASAPRH